MKTSILCHLCDAMQFKINKDNLINVATGTEKILVFLYLQRINIVIPTGYSVLYHSEILMLHPCHPSYIS